MIRDRTEGKGEKVLSRLWAERRAPWGAVSQPRDHVLNRNQESDTQPAVLPRHLKTSVILIGIHVICTQPERSGLMENSFNVSSLESYSARYCDRHRDYACEPDRQGPNHVWTHILVIEEILTTNDLFLKWHISKMTYSRHKMVSKMISIMKKIQQKNKRK